MKSDDEAGNSHTKHLMSRRNAIKLGAAAVGAVALGSNTQGADAAEGAPLVIKKRFTLPPSVEANIIEKPLIPKMLFDPAAMGKDVIAFSPQFTSIRGQNYQSTAVFTDEAGSLHIGVNMPCGGRLDAAEIILVGVPGKNDLSHITARQIDKKHFIAPADNDPDKKDGAYIKLGETKVRGVAQDSVAFMVALEPGQSIYLNQMKKTLAVPENKDLQLQGAGTATQVISNTSEEIQKVALLVPPEEYKFMAGGKSWANPLTLASGKPAKAEDIETIRNGGVAYKATRDAATKTKQFEILEPIVWNMFANMVIDAGINIPPEKLRGLYDELGSLDGKEQSEKMKSYYDSIVNSRNKQIEENQKDPSKGKHPRDFTYAPDEVAALLGGPKNFTKATSLLLAFMQDVMKRENALSGKGAALDRPNNHVESLAMSENRRDLLSGLFPDNDGRGGRG